MTLLSKKRQSVLAAFLVVMISILLIPVTAQATSVATTTNDDATTLISYTGVWKYSNGRSGDYLGDVHYTSNNGDYFELPFRGTGIEYITETNTDMGQVDIYIDGVLQTTVDCYSASKLVTQTMFSKTDLVSGPHVFKAVKRSGTNMMLDSLNVYADNNAPSASSVWIAGVLKKKQTIQANYTFSDPDSDTEGSSQYKWYMSDSSAGTFTPITGPYNKTIALTSDLIGKYIKVEVNPVDQFGMSGAPVQSAAIGPILDDVGNSNTDWFLDGKYGISNHFISNYINRVAANDSEKWQSTESWNDVVNGFDVNAYAQQVAQTGASFVILTLGQNTGYLLAPNATYDKIAGLQPGQRTATRDLPMEIADALAPYGIKLMLYIPANPPVTAGKTACAPGTDPGTTCGYEISDAYNFRNGDIPQTQFTEQQWQSVIRDYSLRYGSKLAGWWFDGVFPWTTSEYDDLTKRYNWYSLTDAAKAGNPNRIIAYSLTGSSPSPYQDFNGGESNSIGSLPTNGRWADAQEGIQWFNWTPLGSYDPNWGGWGNKGAANNTTNLVNWVKNATDLQGVICMDIKVNRWGQLDPDAFAQLHAVKSAVKDVPPVTPITADDPALTYTGSWSTSGIGSGYYNNTGHYTTTANNSAQFIFNGTSISWYGVKGADHGKADVYIDGILDGTVDTYSSTRSVQALLYSKSGLSSGTHTFKIVVRSDRNPSASNNYVEVDDLTYTPAITKVDDALATYTGSWSTSGFGSGYYNNTDHYTTSMNSTAEYTFSGTSVSWYGVKGSDHGKADVYIDGMLDSTIDTYSATRSVQAGLYTKTGLSSGSHTIKIVVRSDRNASSSGNYVEVDYLSYTPLAIIDSNLALRKPATESSTYNGGSASRAVDGNTNGVWSNNSVTHTNSEAGAWWQVDLGDSHNIGDIQIYNRTDCCSDRLSDFNVLVLDQSQNVVWSNHQTIYPNPSVTVNASGVSGRYIKIQLTGTNNLSLAEVKVYEYVPPTWSGTKVNDSDSSITISGAVYSANRGLGDYADDLHNISAGGYYQFSFTGTKIRWISEKESNAGNANVYIDGVLQQQVSTYNGARLVQQAAFEKTGLTSGTHTIKVEWVSGNCTLDAFEYN